MMINKPTLNTMQTHALFQRTLPWPPWGSTGLCIGGVCAACPLPDWLTESERDWMLVSETVVQILGEPCLFSLLLSST